MCDADFSWVDFLFQGMSVGLVRCYQGVHEQWNTLCVPNCLTSCCSVSSQAHGSLASLCSLTLHTHSRAGKPERWTRRCFSPHLYTHVLCMEPSVPVSSGGWHEASDTNLWALSVRSPCLRVSLTSLILMLSKQNVVGVILVCSFEIVLYWAVSFPIGFFLDVFLSFADNLTHCWGQYLCFEQMNKGLCLY